MIEWQKVAEDWIGAGRQLKVLHYEEVTPILCQIGFYIVGNLDLFAPQSISDITQLSLLNNRWSKTLSVPWRTSSASFSFLETKEDWAAFPTLTSPCRRGEPRYPDLLFLKTLLQRWSLINFSFTFCNRNICNVFILKNPKHFKVLEAMKAVDSLLVSHNLPRLPWASYDLPFWTGQHYVV